MAGMDEGGKRWRDTDGAGPDGSGKKTTGQDGSAAKTTAKKSGGKGRESRRTGAKVSRRVSKSPGASPGRTSRKSIYAPLQSYAARASVRSNFRGPDAMEAGGKEVGGQPPQTARTEAPSPAPAGTLPKGTPYGTLLDVQAKLKNYGTLRDVQESRRTEALPPRPPPRPIYDNLSKLEPSQKGSHSELSVYSQRRDKGGRLAKLRGLFMGGGGGGEAGPGTAEAHKPKAPEYGTTTELRTALPSATAQPSHVPQKDAQKEAHKEAPKDATGWQLWRRLKGSDGDKTERSANASSATAIYQNISDVRESDPHTEPTQSFIEYKEDQNLKKRLTAKTEMGEKLRASHWTTSLQPHHWHFTRGDRVFLTVVGLISVLGAGLLGLWAGHVHHKTSELNRIIAGRPVETTAWCYPPPSLSGTSNKSHLRCTITAKLKNMSREEPRLSDEERWLKVKQELWKAVWGEWSDCGATCDGSRSTSHGLITRRNHDPQRGCQAFWEALPCVRLCPRPPLYEAEPPCVLDQLTGGGQETWLVPESREGRPPVSVVLGRLDLERLENFAHRAAPRRCPECRLAQHWEFFRRGRGGGREAEPRAWDLEPWLFRPLLSGPGQGTEAALRCDESVGQLVRVCWLGAEAGADEAAVCPPSPARRRRRSPRPLRLRPSLFRARLARPGDGLGDEAAVRPRDLQLPSDARPLGLCRRSGLAFRCSLTRPQPSL